MLVMLCNKKQQVKQQVDLKKAKEEPDRWIADNPLGEDRQDSFKAISAIKDYGVPEKPEYGNWNQNTRHYIEKYIWYQEFIRLF